MKDTSKSPLSSQTLQTAMSCYRSGQPLVAEEMCRKILLEDPRNAQSLQMLGTIAAEAGRYEEAVALLGQATQIKKNNPQLFYDLGLALQKWGKADEALLKYRKALSLKPDYDEAHINIGDILEKQGRFDEAELKYRRVIALKPDHAVMYHSLGRVLIEQGKQAEAVPVYQKAIALAPDMVEAYSNLGVIFKGQKKFDAAAELYKQAIARKPDYAEARFNFGNLLRDQRKPDEAIAQYAEAIARRPDFVEPHINLAELLKDRGMLDEAILLYEGAMTLRPDNPKQLAELVHAFYHASAWDKIPGPEARLLEAIRRKREGISPFAILGIPATAEDQLICARAFCRGEVKQQALFRHTPKKTGDKIKIGYLSYDLRNHAVAHLIVELFERHDRARFHVTAYSYGPDDKSPLRARLVKAFDDFVDVSEFPDRESAQRIYDDNIDILIDLGGGHTTKARIGIPALRPAPLQVNYLGFPGTMGADFIDYIIADRFIIPADQEKFYSEKVVCLPDTYQPNDTNRKIAETTPTRQACGLPAQGVVFCSFNATYKITPAVFDLWMRLLKKTPGSVLWLLESNQSVKAHLKQEIERRGVDPARMIFAPRVSPADNLARQRLADLFLDTLPVNAHTTTSDALWAGLPVLTCAGSTFAGRVAGSLLKAADLSELITYSLEDYEALALRLAQNPARLAEIRQKLERTRLQVPLFDIEKFTKNIEKSYQTMFDLWQSGKNPEAFSVS